MNKDPALAAWVGFLVALGFKRLGPATAKSLVAAFGSEVLDALGDASRLLQVKGVGPTSAKAWSSAWQAHPAWKQLARWLVEQGLSPHWALDWEAHLGADALALLGAEPLRLLALGPWGQDALRVAECLCPGLPSLSVQALALHGTVVEAWTQGHFGTPLPSAVRRLLRRRKEWGALSHASWLAAAQLLEAHGAVVLRELSPDVVLLHEAGAWALEGELAKSWAHLARRKPEAPILLRDAAQSALAKHPDLDADQQAAVLELVGAPLGLLTGGPGSGKTTALRALMDAWESLGLQVALASPTGRAARRMSEAIGRAATTVHQLLGCDASALPRHGPLRPLPAQVVVVDEAGMLDLELAAMLAAAMIGPCQLLLVGDVDQLAPVGAGQPFADLLASGMAPVVRLGGGHRQAAGSSLAQVSAAWRAGQLPELKKPAGDGLLGAFFWPTEHESSTMNALLAAVVRGLPDRLGMKAESIQVIAARHAGPLGTRAINQAIQKALGRPEGPSLLLADGHKAGRGDRVMALANRHELGLANGDAGHVLQANSQGLEVAFPFGQSWISAREAASLLGLAYAISGHKAQGSGYPAVLCPYAAGQVPSRAWSYTALTRAEKLWVGIGDRQAWSASLQQQDSPRHTALATRLQAF